MKLKSILSCALVALASLTMTPQMVRAETPAAPVAFDPQPTCCDVDMYLAPNPPHPNDPNPGDPNSCYSKYAWKLAYLTVLFKALAQDECGDVSLSCGPGFLDCECLEMVRTKTPVLIDGIETTIPDLQNQYYIEYLSCLLNEARVSTP